MDKRLRSHDQRRAEIAVQAAAMGIDEAYISTLVDSFYDNIRAHAMLGPIFDFWIGDKWSEHLPKMKSFWSSVALNTGHYDGRPLPAHIKLDNVEPWHFDIWLALFHRTLMETAPSAEAMDYFMVRAERIAESLKLAMFGVLGDKEKPSGKEQA